MKPDDSTIRIAAVIGPYSAPDSWRREENIRVAEMVATAVMDAPGWASVCVHTMSRHWHGYVTEDKAIAWSLELVRRSDAVVLVWGWQQSRGTIGEIRLAIELGMPIYACLHDFVVGVTTTPEQFATVLEQGAQL